MLNQLLFFLARRFVAGLTMEAAVKAVQQLNRQGIQATLDVLGENVKETSSAEAAVSSYLATLDSIRQTGIDSNVSLKLTQMGLDIGRDYCLSNLQRICKRAGAGNNFVRIDMEGSTYTERTLSVLSAPHRGGSGSDCKNGRQGAALQGSLQRAGLPGDSVNDRNPPELSAAGGKAFVARELPRHCHP
jgi:hypothetical protein